MSFCIERLTIVYIIVVRLLTEWLLSLIWRPFWNFNPYFASIADTTPARKRDIEITAASKPSHALQNKKKKRSTSYIFISNCLNLKAYNDNLVPRASYSRYQKGKKPWERGWYNDLFWPDFKYVNLRFTLPIKHIYIIYIFPI